jgi:hypothetical protein
MDDTEQILAVLKSSLMSSDSSARETAADEVTDVHKSFSEAQLREIVRALIQARLAERDEGCQEAELNALADLKEWHDLDASWFVALRDVASESLVGSQAEYMETLLAGAA